MHPGPTAPRRSRRQTCPVPFNPDGEIRLPTLQYLITNAQLLALEQRRSGDLRPELQVKGSLPQSAAGRALAVDSDAATMLAGWDPDQSYWLTDVLSPAGEPVRWEDREGGTLSWTPAPAA